MSLQIAIIGSGLAGLAVARILREHHEVTVYERGGPDIATGGQGICLFSNGIKMLQTMGFDRDRAGAVPCHGFRTFDKDGMLVKDFPVDFEGKYKAETMTMKRSDFRDELLRLATAPSEKLGIQGSPAKMVFNTSVVDVEPDEGLVVFKDGSTIQADVVIGEFSRIDITEKRLTQRQLPMACIHVSVIALSTQTISQRKMA